MFFFLLLAIIALPLIELTILIRIVRTISLLPTIGLILLAGLIGSTLARRQSARMWTRVQTDMAAGRMPSAEILDGLMIFAAGVLLVIPGVISDVIGFALLIPLVRAFLRRRIANHLRTRIVVMQGGAPLNDDFIDVEAVEVRESPAQRRLT